MCQTDNSFVRSGPLGCPCRSGASAMASAPPGTPSRGATVSEETVARLRDDVTRLTRALGVPPGRGLEGVTTASVQMLSKMISRYEVTKAR